MRATPPAPAGFSAKPDTLPRRDRLRISSRTVGGQIFLRWSQTILRMRAGSLIRHKAAGDFGARPGGHDGFAALALITAGQAVDFKRRPRAALFHGREAALAEQFFHADQFLKFGGRDRQALELFAFISRKRRNVVVETGNGDAAVFIAQSGEQLAQGHRRVVQRAAENAGMQIARRAVHRDFKGDDAAQANTSARDDPRRACRCRKRRRRRSSVRAGAI